MKETNRFWNLQNLFILLGLLLAQFFLFFKLIEVDDSGPLGTLAIFYWAGGTVLAIIIHLLLITFGQRQLLYLVALGISVLFWTVAWTTYNYRQNTADRRQRIEISDGSIQTQETGKAQLEKLLREKNIFYTWLPDSLCYRINEDKGMCYYLNPGEPNGEGITVVETMEARLNTKDTAAWIRGLKHILPLLNAQQILLLNKSLKEKSFCLSNCHQGYSNAYPCWRTVVSQRYDSLSGQLFTSMHFPY